MAVLNDFEANGYGVTALDEKHVVVLNDVLPTEKAGLSPLPACRIMAHLLFSRLKCPLDRTSLQPCCLCLGCAKEMPICSS